MILLVKGEPLSGKGKPDDFTRQGRAGKVNNLQQILISNDKHKKGSYVTKC